MSDYQKPVPNLMKALRESLEKAVQPPATPQEPEQTWGPFFDQCEKCVTRTHCAHHDRCLAECVPADLRASTPSPEGQTWQPIETAPKDGSEVLVIYDADSHEVGPAYFSRADGGQDAWMWADLSLDDENCFVGNPTYWMPLPSPPTPEGTQP